MCVTKVQVLKVMVSFIFCTCVLFVNKSDDDNGCAKIIKPNNHLVNYLVYIIHKENILDIYIDLYLVFTLFYTCRILVPTMDCNQ